MVRHGAGGPAAARRRGGAAVQLTVERGSEDGPGDVPEVPAPPADDYVPPLPPLHTVLSGRRVIRTSRTAGAAPGEPDAASPGERSTSGVFRVPTVDRHGQTRMWAKPEYWDRENYQGYWEDLELLELRWRTTTRIVAILVLTGLFFTPELIDGLWWLTLVISELVVGAIVILGAPNRRRLVAVVVVAVALAGFASLEAFNDLEFGTLSLSGPPPQVLACGAVYEQTSISLDVPKSLHLHQVGTTPSGLAMLGNAQCGNEASVWVFVSLGGGMVMPYLESQYVGPPVPYSQ
jgi:hypothetical protein